MKKLIFILSLTTIFSLTAFQLQAQDYQTAIGARIGYPASASFKHFINDSHAIEVYAGGRWYNRYNWFNVSGAYLVHMPIESADGLNWYFGGGGSVYFWNYDDGFADGAEDISFGVQGYLGLEYTFADVPISISGDWIPAIFLTGYESGFGGRFGSLAVRYVLSR